MRLQFWGVWEEFADYRDYYGHSDYSVTITKQTHRLAANFPAPKEHDLMNLPRVFSSSLVIFALVCGFGLQTEGKAEAMDWFSLRTVNHTSHAISNCTCEKCACAGKPDGNLFKRSMNSLMRHLNSMMPFKAGCDEVSCDDGCDAMMLDELMELQDAIESDASSSLSPSIDADGENQAAEGQKSLELDTAVIVAPLGDADAARKGNTKPPVADQLQPLEPNPQDSESIRSRILNSSIQLSNTAEGKRATVIPLPIRNGE